MAAGTLTGAPRASRRADGLVAAAVLGLVAALASAAGWAQPECLVLDNFTGATLGVFPDGWQPRKEEGRPVYAVREEDGRRFLRAAATGLGIQAGRPTVWNLDRFPVLAWSWRPVEFPRGADEREASTNDSVLAVYFLVPYSRLVGPRAVKYVWSEKVPVGTRLESNLGLTQVRVLRSGTAGRDAWHEERVNVLEDFRRTFGEAKTPTPAGIAVLTDSDDTKSNAVGDYANFRACVR